MKKFTLLVALFAAMTISAKNLPFKIAGVQATSENIETLVETLNAKDKIDSYGKLSYDTIGNVMILEDFFVGVKTTENIPALEVAPSTNIHLYLIGENTFSTDKSTGVLLNEGSILSLTGSGRLTILTQEAGAMGFAMDNFAAVNVQYTTLEMHTANSSSFVALNDNAAQSTVLSIVHSQVKVTYKRNGDNKGYAVENIKTLHIEFSDVEFNPNGMGDEKLLGMRVSELSLKAVKLDIEDADKYTFSPEDKNYKNGTVLANKLKWARDWKDTTYKVLVQNEANDGSKKEYKWETTVQGSIILRNDTLFLKNANIGTYQEFPGITLVSDKAVTIHLEGENVITTYDNMAGIYSYHGVAFVGKGKLRVGGYDAGIMVQEGVWVKGEPESPEITVIGERYGICNAKSEPYDGEWTLRVDKGADLTISVRGTALHLNNSNTNKGLSLNGVEIGAPFDAESVFDASEVHFATPEWVAPIEIAGHPINSLNSNNLHDLLHATKFDTKGEDPHISYQKESGSLYFKNARVRWTEAKNGPFLKIGEKLTIYASSTNEIELTSAVSFIQTNYDVTIQGLTSREEDKLVAYGIDWGQIAQKAAKSGTFVQLEGDATLLVSGVVATANAFEHGIVGAKEGTNKVYFQGAAAMLEASKEAVMEINDMSFYKCAIAQPAGAEFSAELKGIAKDGKLVTGEQVFIRTKEEAIENIGQEPRANSQKLLQDGRLFIQLPDGTLYDATGRKQ